MVQFLSIIFFSLDFFNFCWVFQKFPFFVSPFICDFQSAVCTGSIHYIALASNPSGKSHISYNYEYHYSHIIK